MSESVSKPRPGPGPDRPPRLAPKVLAGGLIAPIARIVALPRLLTPASPGSAAPSYVGSAACNDCHPGESAAHSRSGHARTLRPASKAEVARRLDGQTVADPELPGVAWHFALAQGQFTAERGAEGEVEKLVLEYAFGSGHHAVTFVTLDDRDPDHPTLVEHRLTAFAHTATPGLTPGQSLKGHASGNSPRGRTMTAANVLDCFRCHSTRTSDRGPERLEQSTMIRNVTCEKCHGPAGAHVEAARRGASGDALALPFGPGRYGPADEMRLCGDCHRLPEMITPGAIRVENPVILRHQPVGLMQSACYKGSGGTLTCGTCHDPHARTSDDRASYEAICLSCHRGPSHTPCPVSPDSGCVGCHMPRRDAARGMMFSDHWIPARPAG